MKKIYSMGYLCPKIRLNPKIFLPVKLMLFLMCASILTATANGYSQDKKLSLDVQASTLENVFQQIEKQSEFLFFYTDEVDLNRTVSIAAIEKPINEILRDVFSRTGIEFKIMDKHIVLYKPDSNSLNRITQIKPDFHAVVAGKQAINITGVVSDVKGDPIPGVVVSIKGTNNGTITDLKGNYTIKANSAEDVLMFTFVGFQTQEFVVGDKTSLNVTMKEKANELEQIVVVGYGTKKKEAITSAIANVAADDIDRVHASTTSGLLAGKLSGLAFRGDEGRPGASAMIQIRNMGDPLFVIDGTEKDAGQFNNLGPSDIENITILKDASAAIYGSRAANGVVIVTTKRGKVGQKSTLSVNTYTGIQNWARFPKTVNAYQWMSAKADAENNQQMMYGGNSTQITTSELEKWKAGTEQGYKSFDWYDFIIGKNAPQSQVNVNASGGSETTNYYISLTHLNQDAVLKEYNFKRTNLQSNIDTKIGKNIKAGISIDGRIETRENPGIPGTDDYWGPRFALFRNRPTERPYANDNPLYPQNSDHNDTNWALQTEAISGVNVDTWRIIDPTFKLEYETPLKGLKAKLQYSYYYANRMHNNHEYTYQTYDYDKTTGKYNVTGGSSNPYRERDQATNIETNGQLQLEYNNTFGQHTVSGTLVAQRIDRTEVGNHVHTVPGNNVLPILQFSEMDTYDDYENDIARIGYVGRVSYSYANKYFIEGMTRRDASWKFAPSKRVGWFPSINGGWRISEEGFYKAIPYLSKYLNDVKLRASYGVLGDDNIGIDPFAWKEGYNYPQGKAILDGSVVTTARYKGIPVTNLTWFTSKILDIGMDFSMMNGKITGSFDYFDRKRHGLPQQKYDVIPPAEFGDGLPQENLRSDEHIGGELEMTFHGKYRDLDYSIGGNFSYARHRNLDSYKPRFYNTLDEYRNSTENRWGEILWGYETDGQFQSLEEIRNYKVNIDGQGNKTLLPGSLIYKDQNGDGKIDNKDERPIGYSTGTPPFINFGFTVNMAWKGIDFTADFSGAAGYSYVRNWEMRVPFQNGGNLLSDINDSHWHRADIMDVNSAWVSGKYPALTFNNSGHSDNNKTSTFWLVNQKYLRCRTIELGYTIPQVWTSRVKVQKFRIYVNTNNLFCIDNVGKFGVDPEIVSDNGLQYPPNRLVNVGLNLTF